MLFYLTDSLVVDKTHPNFKEIKTTVFNLAVQSANGYHALCGDIKAITHFRDLFKSEYVVGFLFNKIYQNFAFEVVPPCINYYIEVVISKPLIRKEGNITIAQVEYKQLNILEVTNKTSLVCEYINDADFYSFVLKWYTKQLGVMAHCAYNKVNGGGVNTYEIIENELASNHITLSILDTDRRYPGDSIKENSTYGKCIGIGSGNVLYKLVPLDVHELENLMPTNYINQEFASWTRNDPEYACKKRAFDFLNNDAESILPYFDLKKGIVNNEEYRSTRALQVFAENCYRQNEEMVAQQPDFQIYVASIDDKKKIYPELIGGTGIIKMVLKVIHNGGALEPNLYEFQQKNWKRIGQEMLNWCIAREPESI